MGSKICTLWHYIRFQFSPQKKDEQYIATWQRKKINKYLKKVTATIPFYYKFKGRQLEEFPVVTKEFYMDNFLSMNSMGITQEQAVDFAIASEKSRNFQGKLGKTTVGLSSGTSGRRGVFLVSDREKSIWAGYVLSHFLPKGLLKKTEIAFFMRANSNLYEEVSSKKIKFQFYDIFKPMEEHVIKLNENKPDILVGQPSVLLALGKAKAQGRLYICPSKVISVAEVLEEADAEKIKKAFDVSVLHQAYQCTEGCLALTCSCGNLHINQDIVHIEKEYLDEKRFVPIVTDFTRRTQPILRYRLNDILQENKEPCPCGSNFTRIEKIEGREDDMFYFAQIDGGEDVGVYPDFLRRCVLFAGEINDYRIVQQPDKNISIYSNISTKERGEIVAQLKKLSVEQGFELPQILFYDYTFNKEIKLKRVERVKV